ncbi:MAG TPA: alginate export family protein, partial [Candidatus Nitrosotalea sp.]|nr:alginate export family protein [Candidatus Nitrosotalea sp.]
GLPVNPGWVETYANPGITAEYRLARGAYLYGGFSYLESGTIGNDYTGSPYAWYGLPEDLYAGLHLSHQFGGKGTLDVSFGQQDYATGGGMLLALGATNGGSRGADYIGPRTAWRQAALVRTTDGDWVTQFFYLRPNEAPDVFTNTALTGVNVVWNPPGQLRLGAQYIYASSDVTTRNQSSTYEFRARFHPFKTQPAFWLQADYAIEGKPQLAADGWMLQANYNLVKLWWKPLVSVGYYSMSGANPANAVIWNGFDPLYFGGNVPAWQPGFAFQSQLNNTNLRYFDTSIDLTPDKSDSLQINYINANVDRVNAPLAIPAPSLEMESTAGGLPSPGYGQELGASYIHQLTAALSLNPVFAYAWPGNGIVANYGAHGGAAHNWTFLGVAFTASY